MINKITNGKGFTLIEILASIVLLTVVISLFLSIFPQMANTNNRNGDNLDAANVGKEILVLVKDTYTIESSSLQLNGNIPDFTIADNTPSSILLEGFYETLRDNFFIEIEVDTLGAFLNSSVKNQLYQVTIRVYQSENSTNVLTTTHGYIKGS